MKTVYETEVLQAISKKELKKFWQGHVVEDEEGKFYTRSKYWQEKKDGTNSEIQFGQPYFAEPTNVGKANERGNYDQAIFNITSDFAKQKDKGYRQEGEEQETVRLLPVLAHEYHDKKHKLSESLYIQPKLDGVRILNVGNNWYTRMGKDVIPEVVEHLRVDTDLHLDGELILPKPYTFQDSISAIKRYKETSKQLEYWVFDIVDPELTFKERFDKLKRWFKTNTNDKIKLVDTYDISEEVSKAENRDVVIEDQTKVFVKDGYEGAIIRDHNGKYNIGNRSEHLLKFKFFKDSEFLIKDVIEGNAKEKGCAIFVCLVEKGQEFLCRPKGTVEQRKQMFDNKETFIGKKLTVRYQELTDDGIPRFPVGLAVRDYE